MRTSIFTFPAAAALLCAGLISCQSLESGQDGSISVKFLTSRASGDKGIPDTDDFLLSITGSDGTVIYSGRFGDAPEKIPVAKGSYTVSAVSEKFDEAAFESPQYGDSREVVVKSGENVCAELICAQTNSGIRLVPDGSFEDAFPGGILYVSGDDGCLVYEYGESRTAYFSPGKVSVSLSQDGMQNDLFTRTLKAAQMLSVKISATVSGDSGGLSIQIDTSRQWTSDSYTYGGGGSSSAEEAMDVLEAREHIGDCGVWVRGYIVGSAKGSSSYEFESPFSKETNILLGLRSGTSDSEYCLSVELKNKTVRAALNLPGNPELHRRQVYIKGDLVSSYYGIPGLKNVTEYQLK